MYQFDLILIIKILLLIMLIKLMTHRILLVLDSYYESY